MTSIFICGILFLSEIQAKNAYKMRKSAAKTKKLLVKTQKSKDSFQKIQKVETDG